MKETNISSGWMNDGSGNGSGVEERKHMFSFFLPSLCKLYPVLK